jgi:hypothetical protein
MMTGGCVLDVLGVLWCSGMMVRKMTTSRLFDVKSVCAREDGHTHKKTFVPLKC